MPTNTTRREQIARSLKKKQYREAFVASQITIGLPSQIREMRLSRGWNQTELGARAEIPQAQVSRFEQKGYGGFTLTTLRKLASVFDVALKVRFVPFSELVDDSAFPEMRELDVPSFDADIRLNEGMSSGLVIHSSQPLIVAGTAASAEILSLGAGSQMNPSVNESYKREAVING